MWSIGDFYTVSVAICLHNLEVTVESAYTIKDVFTKRLWFEFRKRIPGADVLINFEQIKTNQTNYANGFIRFYLAQVISIRVFTN